MVGGAKSGFHQSIATAVTLLARSCSGLRSFVRCELGSLSEILCGRVRIVVTYVSALVHGLAANVVSPFWTIPGHTPKGALGFCALCFEIAALMRRHWRGHICYDIIRQK